MPYGERVAGDTGDASDAGAADAADDIGDADAIDAGGSVIGRQKQGNIVRTMK